MPRNNTKVKAVQTLLALKEQFKDVQAGIQLKLTKISELMSVGETVEVDDATYELKDNFADTNTVFRPACVHRFDIVEVK